MPDQWQGTYKDKLDIIGDKKGGTTASILFNKPEELERVQKLGVTRGQLGGSLRIHYDGFHCTTSLSSAISPGTAPEVAATSPR